MILSRWLNLLACIATGSYASNTKDWRDCVRNNGGLRGSHPLEIIAACHGQSNRPLNLSVEVLCGIRLALPWRTIPENTFPRLSRDGTPDMKCSKRKKCFTGQKIAMYLILMSTSIHITNLDCFSCLPFQEFSHNVVQVPPVHLRVFEAHSASPLSSLRCALILPSLCLRAVHQ